MALDSMEATIHILVPMIVGAFSAFFVFRMAHEDAYWKPSGQRGRLEKTSEKELFRNVEIFQSYIDKILLNVLLPLLFLVGLFSAKLRINELFVLIACGFLIPWVTYQCSRLWFNNRSNKIIGLSNSWVPFLPATFGGGNRGTLLILIISLTIVPFLGGKIQPTQVVAIFSLIDFGNFLFLLLLLKPRLFKSVEQAVTKNKESLPNQKLKYKEAGIDDDFNIDKLLRYIGPGAVTIGVLTKIIAEFLPPQSVMFMNENFYSLVGSYLGSIFSYLAFVSLFIGIPRGHHEVHEAKAQIRFNQLSTWLSIWVFTRTIGVLIAFITYHFVAGYLHSKVQVEFPESIFLICFGIFIILPPSSVLPAFVNEAYRRATKVIGKGQDGVEEIQGEIAIGKLILSKLLVGMNVVYVLLVLSILLYLNV